jgi:hypothetical protein
MNDSTTPEVTGDTSTAANAVHVIQSTFHYRDADGRPVTEEQVMVDEGWFDDIASAIVRREQLSDQNRRLYELDMDKARRDREAKIATAEQTNAEVAVLRENGFAKEFVQVPTVFVPMPFEEYLPERSFTTYDVVEIHRSEFDGIASAAGATKS